jgi:hypothetical protein
MTIRGAAACATPTTDAVTATATKQATSVRFIRRSYTGGATEVPSLRERRLTQRLGVVDSSDAATQKRVLAPHWAVRARGVHTSVIPQRGKLPALLVSEALDIEGGRELARLAQVFRCPLMLTASSLAIGRR